MRKNSIAGRIVKNVNRVLEVVPRTLNRDADVIRLDFKKKPRARKSLTGGKKRKAGARKSRTIRSRAASRASRKTARAA